MKHGIIKVAAATPAIRVADIKNNLTECIRLAGEAAERGAKILVFPELTLTGATAGDLFFTKTLLSSAEDALSEFADATADMDILAFIGLPVSFGGRVYNAVCATNNGDILAVIPKQQLSSAQSRYFGTSDESFEVVFAGQETFFGSDLLLSCDSVDDLTVAVSVGSEIESPLSTTRLAALSGASVIVNPYAAPELVCRGEKDIAFLKSESRVSLSCIIRAEAGFGESGTDGVYSGRSVIAERGNILSVAEPYTDGLIYADIDTEFINKDRLVSGEFGGESGDYTLVDFSLDVTETRLENAPVRLPFVPEGEELKKRCSDIIKIQSYALAGRIKRSYSKGAVVGVSGGLDSTLALLVAAEAMDILGESREKILAVTMPCFGTTKRTKGNAERLAESLGATLKCIDIKASVSQHFADIGHNPDDFSVVYENAQARERTQVLMDIANAEGALVVGTGDLSELALGWATYNGDHMSMYGVNAGIPKTLMRYIVSYFADKAEGEGKIKVADVLRDVLNTPVSPELLPPKDGEIAQCTEGIVGPYELHDFFLWYHVRYGASPDKILRLASAAFDGEYDEETVKGWLKVFLRRFFSQQFKRSCLPDGPKVGSVGFSPRGDFNMPSDAVGALWNI